MYAVAFSKVSYLAPDPYDRAIADAALARICIPRHPLGNNGEIIEQIPDKDDCVSKLSDLSIQGTEEFYEKSLLFLRKAGEKHPGPPVSFAKAYPEASFNIVNRQNILEFVG